MAKLPIILEAGRADGKLIKTNSVYDDNQEKFLSDKIKEIDDNHNTLKDNINIIINIVNNNKSDIENKLEEEQTRAINAESILNTNLEAETNRAITTEDNLKETINNITNINEHAATAELITVNTLPNSTISNVQQALDDLYENIIYDVSALNGGIIFESLSALLSSSNLSTLIPTSVRHGGMSIRFIQSSNNKYVQFIYNSISTAIADFTNENNWEKNNLEKELNLLDELINGDEIEIEKVAVSTFTKTYLSSSNIEGKIVLNYNAAIPAKTTIFEISAGKKYTIDVPKTFNGLKVLGYINELPTQGTSLTCDGKYIGNVNGNNSEMYFVINESEDYNYIAVTYNESGEIPTLKEISQINGLIGNVGDLGNLTTQNKSSIVVAINEVNLKTGDIGNLNSLATTDKSSLVEAINEVNSKVVEVDTTLTQSGKAADAKTVGDTLTQINNALTDVEGNLGIINEDINGGEKEVEIIAINTYEHQYFAGKEPYLQTYYLASSRNSLVAFPITKDKKYKIDIPKSPNDYSNVVVYSNILPIDGEATNLFDSNSSAVTITTEKGDANPMTVNIAAAENYSYIIVCYQTDGGVPTCITETKTKGLKTEIGNLNELITTNKSNLVAAINEIKVTPLIKIDNTLSKEGEAADAKAVGVAINGTTSKIDVTSTDTYANSYFASSNSPNTVIVNYNTAIGSSIIVYPLIYGTKYELNIPKTQGSARVWAYLNELPIAGQQTYCEGRFVDDTMGDGYGMNLIIDAALDYKYLAVCYMPNSGVPILKRVETSGGVYSKIGNFEALQTQNKTSLVAAINEATNTPIEICLPDKIYAVVGDTLQLFLRSVVKTVNPYNYSIKITCSKGHQFNRYFEYAPTAGDVGTTDFTIVVRNNNEVLLGSKTCSLITAAAPTSPSSQINIASFGDSLSGPGKWQEEACRRLIDSGGIPAGHRLNNIAFVGKITKDGWLAHWCGYGGWTWSSYTSAGLKCFRFVIPSFTSLEIGSVYTNNDHQYTVAEVNPNGDMLFTTSSFDNVPESSGVLTKISGNGDATLTFTSVTKESTNPLWDADNNKMSFIPYANQYCNNQIDVVIAQLGWNGMTSAYQTDFSLVESQVKKFTDCLHSDFPNAKLKILGLALPSQNGACGSTYSLTTVPYSDTYGLTVNVINLNKLYQQIANEPNYSDFVEYIPVAQQFDAENSYPFNVRLKNNRLIIKPFVSDSYYKIGDIVKHENNFYICISEGSVGQWENVYKAYLPYDPYEKFDTNAVHPSDGGYNQIADAVYRNIVANYCQGV